MLAMPKRRGGIAAIGGLLVAVAFGGLLLGMLALAGPVGEAPNLFFYVFAGLAIASGLRMITHPRPVYAALYFILTILSSSGLYVLLSAEFMAFALVIIYAGAILITYLFVIMLATQAPSEEDEERLSDYDAVANEPVMASIVGFAMLALLSTMLFTGAPDLERSPYLETPEATLASQPVKIERMLLDPLREVEGPDGSPIVGEDDEIATRETGAGRRAIVDVEARLVGVSPRGDDGVVDASAVRMVSVPDELWPDDVQGTNVEGLGLNLLGQHPMTIEIAGVILLMAMLGATVLARKQVDIEEALKARQARRLAGDAYSTVSSGEVEP